MRRKAEPFRFLFVGLGNPGPAYTETRHNAGFRVIDRLAEKLGVSLRRPFFKKYFFGEGRNGTAGLVLLKPLTYMNLSGTVLPEFMEARPGPADRLVLVCDNSDLPPGEIRLKTGGGAAGHRGIQSVIQVLGTPDFVRLYVGVGRPEGGGGLADYVLAAPGGDEARRLAAGEDRAVQALEALWNWKDRPLEHVMNEYNRRTTP